MTYATISEMNITGLQDIFVYTNQITSGFFMKAILIMIWVAICLGSYFVTKKAIGTGDFPASFIVASFITLVFAFILRLSSTQIVDNISIGILLVLNLIGIAMLMLTATN